MSRLDDLIDQALNDEDDELADELSREPGYFEQALGLFSGRLAWVHWLIMIVQSIMFFAGVFMAVKFFQANEVLDALRWGLPSAVLIICSLVMKSALGPEMTTNRLLLEMRRMEFRIERQRSGQ